MNSLVIASLLLAPLAFASHAVAGSDSYPEPMAKPIQSSPSGNDHGTNSNYPLDARHTVFVTQGNLAPATGGGDSIVQSQNSLTTAFVPMKALAGMPRGANGG